MALQIQNVLKSSFKLANARALSSGGVFASGGCDGNSEYGKEGGSVGIRVVTWDLIF